MYATRNKRHAQAADHRLISPDKHVRTFQHFLWKEMQNTMLPTDWYDAEEQAVLRLSSKSHWDIPLKVKGRIILVLASHPTPPVFDGPHDRPFPSSDHRLVWIDIEKKHCKAKRDKEWPSQADIQSLRRVSEARRFY